MTPVLSTKNEHPVDFCFKKKGQSIILLVGDILGREVDVIVNPVDVELNMMTGKVSKQIWETKDEAVQIGIKNYRNNPETANTLTEGNVIITTGGNLVSKYIFHALLPHPVFMTPSSVYNLMVNILEKTINYPDVKSIAIPLLKTSYSYRGITKRQIIQAMVDGLYYFFRNENKALKVEITVSNISKYDIFIEEFQNKEAKELALQQQGGIR